jgi:hypothetical protein
VAMFLTSIVVYHDSVVRLIRDEKLLRTKKEMKIGKKQEMLTADAFL